MNLSYIINHLGEERDLYFNAVSPPIIQSSNFAFKTVSDMRKGLCDEMNNPFYTRGCNPTVAILRKKIAALEKAEDALIFSSGTAAISAAVMSQVSAGDHVVCVSKPYSWTHKLLTKLLAKFNVLVTLVDGTDSDNYAQAITANTKVLFLESPNSMTFEMQDIEAIVKIAKQHGLITIIDNSYASPIFQNPIKLGIDMVTHSATKYLNGHSDVVVGVLCSSYKICRHIFESEYMTLGGIISPNDAWLVLRGLRTLPVRMAHISNSTQKIIQFLENHSQIEKIYYPHYLLNKQFELAKKQQKFGSGQFSVEIKANNIEQVELFCNSLKYFLMACSWGGYESLIFPISVFYTSENYAETGNNLPFNFIRFYIGLEETDVLIEDLTQALNKLEG